MCLDWVCIFLFRLFEWSTSTQIRVVNAAACFVFCTVVVVNMNDSVMMNNNSIGLVFVVFLVTRAVPHPTLPLTPTCPFCYFFSSNRSMISINGCDLRFLIRRLSHDVILATHFWHSQPYQHYKRARIVYDMNMITNPHVLHYYLPVLIFSEKNPIIVILIN